MSRLPASSRRASSSRSRPPRRSSTRWPSHTADTLTAALEAAGLPDAEVRQASQTWAETLVRFLTNPVVSSLLMTVGLLGILVEIRTPGFAVPGTIGVLFLGLFFWGQWLVQLAGWEELLLVVLGVVLFGLELFVIPGFGVAGIAGIVALVAGLGMALVGAGATGAVVIGALGRVAISILLALGGGLVLLRFLPSLPFGRRFVLETEMRAEAGYSSRARGRSPRARPDRHRAVAAAPGRRGGPRRGASRCRVRRPLHRRRCGGGESFGSRATGSSSGSCAAPFQRRSSTP